MGKNSKPILSVLVDEDKKEKFAELARRYKYSMGWILNDCIDRMLEANSIDVYRASTASEDVNRLFAPTEASIGLSIDSIDAMVKASLEKHLEEPMSTGYVAMVARLARLAIDEHLERLPAANLRGSIEELVKLSIDDRFQTVEKGLDREPIEELIKTSVGEVKGECISRWSNTSSELRGEIQCLGKDLSGIEDRLISYVQKEINRLQKEFAPRNEALREQLAVCDSNLVEPKPTRPSVKPEATTAIKTMEKAEATKILNTTESPVWLDRLTELVSTGNSSREIALALEGEGFKDFANDPSNPNSKKVRKKVEGFLDQKRNAHLKEIYDAARALKNNSTK